MTEDDLRAALAAARFAEGERFELAYKAERGFVGRIFADVPEAFAWIAPRAGERDCYLGLNPIRSDAQPPRGRARDEDVAVVRALLVDCDPQGTPPNVDAALALADRIERVLLTSKGGYPGHATFARVASGRGQQLWLQHEPVAWNAPELVERARLLRALRDRFGSEGATIDVAVGNPSRLVRLPGTVNTKTGQVARLVNGGES